MGYSSSSDSETEPLSFQLSADDATSSSSDDSTDKILDQAWHNRDNSISPFTFSRDERKFNRLKPTGEAQARKSPGASQPRQLTPPGGEHAAVTAGSQPQRPPGSSSSAHNSAVAPVLAAFADSPHRATTTAKRDKNAAHGDPRQVSAAGFADELRFRLQAPQQPGRNWHGHDHHHHQAGGRRGGSQHDVDHRDDDDGDDGVHAGYLDDDNNKHINRNNNNSNNNNNNNKHKHINTGYLDDDTNKQHVNCDVKHREEDTHDAHSMHVHTHDNKATSHPHVSGVDMHANSTNDHPHTSHASDPHTSTQPAHTQDRYPHEQRDIYPTHKVSRQIHEYLHRDRSHILAQARERNENIYRNSAISRAKEHLPADSIHTGTTTHAKNEMVKNDSYSESAHDTLQHNTHAGMTSGHASGGVVISPKKDSNAHDRHAGMAAGYGAGGIVVSPKKDSSVSSSSSSIRNEHGHYKSATMLPAHERAERDMTTQLSSPVSSLRNEHGYYKSANMLPAHERAERDMNTQMMDMRTRTEDMYKSRVMTLERQLAAKDKECTELLVVAKRMKELQSEFEHENSMLFQELDQLRAERGGLLHARDERDVIVVKLAELEERDVEQSELLRTLQQQNADLEDSNKEYRGIFTCACVFVCVCVYIYIYMYVCVCVCILGGVE
jgi:hypothetical protein